MHTYLLLLTIHTCCDEAALQTRTVQTTYRIDRKIGEELNWWVGDLKIDCQLGQSKLTSVKNFRWLLSENFSIVNK